MEKSNLKNNENSVWERDFNSLFSKSDKTEVEMFLSLSEMIMHQQLEDNNLSRLYKAVGLEGFLDIVAVLQNKKIVIPSLDEVRDNYTLAVIYYYKEILGWNWKKIKTSGLVNLNSSILDKENSISYGIRINQLSATIRGVLNEELVKFSEKEEAKNG